MRRKLKYLVRQKDYTAEKDTWKGLENLRNVMELVKRFEKEIREKEIRKIYIRQKKKKLLNPEAKMLKKSELLRKYTVKILFE